LSQNQIALGGATFSPKIYLQLYITWISHFDTHKYTHTFAGMQKSISQVQSWCFTVMLHIL